MVHCCVPGCKNTHHHKSNRGKEEWPNQDVRNYSLHDLPNEDRMEIRELWILAINRTSLPKDVAVCSDHFTEDCFDEKWEEYKRKYGPTKVKRKLKLDAVPTIFPGRMFMHEKVQQIKENWKNKTLQKQIELERMRIEREYKDRFKSTQTECTCKCRCKLRKKHFGQQVNFSFKFMEDVGTQFPLDPNQTVREEHSYHQGKSALPNVPSAVISKKVSLSINGQQQVINIALNKLPTMTATADDILKRKSDALLENAMGSSDVMTSSNENVNKRLRLDNSSVNNTSVAVQNESESGPLALPTSVAQVQTDEQH